MVSRPAFNHYAPGGCWARLWDRCREPALSLGLLTPLRSPALGLRVSVRVSRVSVRVSALGQAGCRRVSLWFPCLTLGLLVWRLVWKVWKGVWKTVQGVCAAWNPVESPHRLMWNSPYRYLMAALCCSIATEHYHLKGWYRAICDGPGPCTLFHSEPHVLSHTNNTLTPHGSLLACRGGGENRLMTDRRIGLLVVWWASSRVEEGVKRCRAVRTLCRRDRPGDAQH